jgi:hypothetical protein
MVYLTWNPLSCFIEISCPFHAKSGDDCEAVQLLVGQSVLDEVLVTFWLAKWLNNWGWLNNWRWLTK